MPFIFDFNNRIGDIKTMEVFPKGWRNPIVVEYASAKAHKYDTQLSVIWRVKGTTHTFTIYEQKLNVLSHGNYKKHFEEALTNFRLDYLNWFEDPEYANAEWRYDYQQQFGKFIISETDNSKQSQNY